MHFIFQQFKKKSGAMAQGKQQLKFEGNLTYRF